MMELADLLAMQILLAIAIAGLLGWQTFILWMLLPQIKKVAKNSDVFKVFERKPQNEL